MAGVVASAQSLYLAQAYTKRLSGLHAIELNFVHVSDEMLIDSQLIGGERAPAWCRGPHGIAAWPCGDFSAYQKLHGRTLADRVAFAPKK
jgi:hypothetical protein